MRIGMITGEYPPMEGGVGDFTHQLSLALHDRDHEMHVFTTRMPQFSEDPTEEAGLTVHRTTPRWGWRALSLLQQRLQELEFDVINIQYQAAAYGMKGAINLFPRVRQIPHHQPWVVTFHDLLPPYLFPKAGPLRQWTVWQLARYADGVIVTNRQDHDALLAALGQAAPPIRMIPIGSNITSKLPEDYDRAAWRRAHGFEPGDIVVGYFGLINRSKGVETLLDSIASLIRRGYQVHLLLIGGSPGSSDATNVSYVNTINAQIADLDLTDRVHRTGFIPQPEVSAALRAVDVCALPYRDGASLRRGTLHAALRHGCAIVTTLPASPIPELEDGRNVLFVPPEDDRALSEAILTLVLNQEARRKMGYAATKLARKFSWPAIAVETEAFFKTLRAEEASRS